MEPVSDCSICWEELKNTGTDVMCLQCRHKVCGDCLLKMKPLCPAHKCIHFKCPTCRKSADISMSAISTIFIGTGDSVVLLGKRKLVRVEERVDDDVTIVTVKRHRLG